MASAKLVPCRRLFRLAAPLVTVGHRTLTKEGRGSTTAVVLPIQAESCAQVETSVVPRYDPRLADLLSEGPLRAAAPDERRLGRRIPPLSVRMSEGQKHLLRQKAAAAGITVNRYVVATVLGADYQPPSDRALVRALLGMSRELSIQGNNLNQIARHLNAGLLSSDQGLAVLGTLANALQNTYRLVRQALADGKGGP
jgi:hypothetical protein